MTPAVGFAAFLAVTIALLALAVWTGLRARRRLHLPVVALALVALGAAIYYAEKLGRLYDLDGAGAIYPFHLLLAKVATGAYLLPIATGFLVMRGRLRRRVHRYAALLTVALTLATAATGGLLIARAPRLPETAGEVQLGVPAERPAAPDAAQ